MKNLKKISLAVSLIGVIGIGSFAYASETLEPTQVTKEFKANNLEHKESVLNERVEQGTISQEEANEILQEIQTNMKNCDGTGSKKIGEKHGVGFGHGHGNGEGRGNSKGQGFGHKNR